MKKRYLYCLLPALCLFFIICFAGISRAQSISGGDAEDLAVDPTGRDGYSAVLYDNTNGLPTSEANAIAETKEGFIWIGSYSGLIRYDGNTFERIDSTTGITSVVSLYVDSSNRLWIGTNDNGIVVKDKDKFTQFKNVEGLRSSSIRSIVEDKAGNIYVATTNGLCVVDGDMKLHGIDISQLNDQYIMELRVDEDGLIYGNTNEGAFFILKNQKLKAYYDGEKLGTGEIKSFLPDPVNKGYVYLGTQNSMLYHGKISEGINSFDSYDVYPLSFINSIEQFGEQVWFCTDNGIGVIEDGKFDKVENIPLNNSIDKMMADYEGNLWFASSRQGVMKIVPNQFTDLSERYGLDKAVVNSTCISDGKLFIGTDNGLIILDKNKKLNRFKIKGVDSSDKVLKECTDLYEVLGESRIRSIVKDSKGRLWFSTYTEKGLVMYDKGYVKTFSAEDGLPAEKVRVVSERSDGIIMVACSGGFALIDENNNIIDTFKESDGLSNTEILTVCEGEDGEMYLGSDGNGIYIIKDDSITNINSSDGLSSEVIMRIKKDPKRDIYWIVTSNSISYMKKDRVTTIKKFPYSNNFDLYENKDGRMWILSSNGIYVVDTEELLKNEEINPVYYNKDNGLPYITTANSYSFLSEEGNLYIAGVAGVTKVNIDEPFENVNSLKMSVPFVEADGIKVYPDDSGIINIPSYTKKLTIFGYVYTYSLVNPKVTYHLEGFDNNLTTLDRTELEPVDYTNLEGGDYTFVMSVQTSFGSGNKELRAKIKKDRAIYEKTWFRILGVLVLLSILAFIVLYYVRRKTAALVKKQNENKIFIREMIEAFAKTIDMKDKYTKGHSNRVAEYTAMLTKELGYDEETVENYYNIALLHDIGKISIPPEVLNKPGKLTDKEFNIIKSHSAQGYKVLKDISIMPELAIGAGYHHERPDGKGYPKGLKGDEIPRVAQIIAVADTFDAMYSDRPYRKRMNFEKAVSIIKEVSGTQLEGDVVDAFLRLVDKGCFKAPDDDGGGTVEDINNIHKKFEKQEKKAEEKSKEESEKKTDEKPDEKPEDTSDEKPDKKPEDTSDEKTEDKLEDKKE